MEKLYNNIVLPDGWLRDNDGAIPYLENPPEVIDVSAGRQLFVDDFLIESSELSPTYHKAVKFAGNPVFYPQTKWEKDEGNPVACPKSGGVWYDEREKKFKMWYEAGWLHQLAYAESVDGLEWTRPDLDVEPGTNKILTYGSDKPENYAKLSGGVDYFRPDSTTVFIDNDASDPSQRYKLFIRNPGGRYPGIAGVSGDGIHFDRFTFTTPIDDRSTIFYNPFRKKWVYSIRAGWHGRSRCYRECDDYLAGAQWQPEEAPKWLCCDELDREDPYIRFAPQLYNVDCVGYESIMLGMFQIMYGPENDVCEKYGMPKITSLIPMYSRDGYHFTRPNRKPLIGASMAEGSWDRGYVQSVGGVCVIHGDELWIYYIGFAGNESRAGRDFFTTGMYWGGSTGIAKLRRDGFVSLDGKGRVTTKKLEFHGKSGMIVNCSGSVRAVITTPDGRTLAESERFFGDETARQLSFSENSVKLSELCGRPVKISFEVDGELYSFGFTDDGGSSGGYMAAGSVFGK